MRIVSLIASATEIVSALGARSNLVGCSHECDWPEDVTTLPALTQPRFDTSMSSRGIDDAVKDVVRDGLSVYDVDRDLLKQLAPDVIITQDQCEVCAASLDDVEAALCDWVEQDIRIVSLHPNTLSDVLSDIGKVGAAIGKEREADALVRKLSQQFDGLKKTAMARRPRVFVLEWIDPPMAAGHWIPALVDVAGGDNVITKDGEPSPYVTLENVAAADPDIIIVAPCGFSLDRTEQEMGAVSSNPIWRDLRAVQSGKVALMDGNRFINRPSPAVFESAAMVSDILWRGISGEGPSAWRWLGEQSS
ncbi:MAG: ABC transporter substrate-binding protein [Alphaproteobacteria bacterium]|nr:ABC transporter substrate-binding protein [Alphaproteobacteria bacterium]